MASSLAREGKPRSGIRVRRSPRTPSLVAGFTGIALSEKGGCCSYDEAKENQGHSVPLTKPPSVTNCATTTLKIAKVINIGLRAISLMTKP